MADRRTFAKQMKYKRRTISLVSILIIYTGSYCVFSALGGYHYDQSGKIRYESGMSASDIVLWHPKHAWFQANYENIDEKNTTRGNTLGYFYAPLILLDRSLINKTIVIEEIANAANKSERSGSPNPPTPSAAGDG